MTQNEIDLDWSDWIADDIADELVIGKVIAAADFARAKAIVAQVIHIHLVSGDRPEATNRRYASKL